MILKAKQRGDGVQLARYLTAMRDNEHVELHEVRGFTSEELVEAFQEADAVARGTRCQKHLFSLSLNPPENAHVSDDEFRSAIGQVEASLGLADQPRAIVFHEKEGRRHAHAVWSRIDGQDMKAIELPYYKNRLKDVSRDLFLEHGWQLPEGYKDKRKRDPLNFTLEEWQQARRTGHDPKLTKSLIRECWNASDNRQALESALQEKGMWLARGDRRGFVAVDWRGETYSLSRMSGAKTKELQSRLGNPKDLLSLGEAKAQIGAKLTPKLKAWAKEEQEKARKSDLAAQFQREQMVQRQRKIREETKARHEERWIKEEKERAGRTPKGLRGLWGWITGKNKQIRLQNEAEIDRAKQRDAAEKHEIIRKQLEERRTLQRQIKLARQKQQEKLQELNRDVASAIELGRIPASKSEQSKSRSRQRETPRGRDRGGEPTPT